MKLIKVKCNSCGNEQEDLVGTTERKPELEPCESCASTKVTIVKGDIEANAASRHPLSGSGPWG